MLACLLAALTLAPPPSVVMKKVIRPDGAAREMASNTGFEEPGGPRGADGWDFWDLGFELGPGGRAGRAARCVSTDPAQQRGALQSIELRQAMPTPVTAGGWSRAEGVDGSPDSGYSIYVDIDYSDGTHLWGQTANFSVGTHDWQWRQVTIVPDKPIARLTIYGLFRGHRGTVWFDDLSLKQLELPAGAATFDGVPIETPVAREMLPLEAPAWLPADTHWLQLRDVAAGSDFLAPPLDFTMTGDGLAASGTCPELGLAYEVTARPNGEGATMQVELRDLRGEDRAVTAVFAVPIDASGATWCDDPRTSRTIERGEYSNTVSAGAGATGTMSWYPLAAMHNAGSGLAWGYPLDQPRLCRLGYNAETHEAFASFDLALTPDSRTPGRATFELAAWPCDARYGFRAALAAYYRMFPAAFAKRVRREGIWMPFTDIATVERPESFGFQFKEGDDNVPWDEAHGVDSFVYIEPMSYWMGMDPDVPRTYDAAMEQLRAQADAGDRRARATLRSGFGTQGGQLVCHLVKAPWSDGALFINNPDPDVPRGEVAWNQAAQNQAIVDSAFARTERPALEGWAAYDGGFAPEPEGGRTGAGIVCRRDGEQAAGARQTVTFEEPTTEQITAAAWCRAVEVTGDSDGDFSLYLDLAYADGTALYGQVAAIATGTHDWLRVAVRATPEKPVRSVALHLLLRGGHRGTAWFDDIELRRGAGPNELANPGFDGRPAGAAPVLDGVYIDSFEMAATTANWRREQFAGMDLPLVFDTQTHEPVALGFQHTWEFCRAMADDLHGRGKLFFANAVLGRFASAAALFDVMGTETDWAPGGVYTPNDDATFLYRRAMCYQKPYCLLLNTDYERFRPEWVDLYFQRCLFYGVFPSFFSHNAADDPYWRNPALYNRDRPLFERVIPVIRELASAGWEPVQYAAIDDPALWIERFGRPDRGVYFSLYNPTAARRPYRVAIEARLGAPEVDVRFAGADCTVAADGQTLAGTLGAAQTLVVRVR